MYSVLYDLFRLFFLNIPFQFPFLCLSFPPPLFPPSLSYFLSVTLLHVICSRFVNLYFVFRITIFISVSIRIFFLYVCNFFRFFVVVAVLSMYFFLMCKFLFLLSIRFLYRCWCSFFVFFSFLILIYISCLFLLLYISVII